MKRSKVFYLLLAVCVIFLADVRFVFSQKKPPMERRIVQLEARVRELASEVNTLKARVSSLEALNAFPSTERLRQGMIQANRDAMISDLNNLAANAYQYRIRPTTMGGGGNSYDNYKIPSRIASNDNGSYALSGVYPDSVAFLATSKLKLGTISCILDITGRLHSFEYSGEFK